MPRPTRQRPRYTNTRGFPLSFTTRIHKSSNPDSLHECKEPKVCTNPHWACPRHRPAPARAEGFGGTTDRRTDTNRRSQEASARITTTPGAHRSPVRVEFPTSGRGRCPNAPRDCRATGMAGRRSAAQPPDIAPTPSANAEGQSARRGMEAFGRRTRRNSTDRHTRFGNRRNPVLADSRRATRAWSSTCGSLRSCVQPRRPPDWGLGESKIPNPLEKRHTPILPGASA